MLLSAAGSLPRYTSLLMMIPHVFACPLCRLQLQDKLQLASTEKKGRSKLQNINGVEVMLPTGECSCHQ